MNRLTSAIATAIVSAITGLAAGGCWLLGNRLAEASITGLVIAAIPVNFFAALVFYFSTRPFVQLARAGLPFLLIVILINMGITIRVAMAVAGLTSVEGAAKIGAHMFSWGMSWAYGQAFHDVRQGTWFGDDT